MHALRHFLTDLIHAARTIAKARSFAFICVTSLGVGMGVAIAILMFARAVTGAPHGIDERGLVEVIIRPQDALRARAGNAIVDTFSYPDYLDVRDAVEGVTMTGWSHGDALLETEAQSTPQPVAAMFVSSNYFSTVGVTLSRGSGFAPAGDAGAAKPEAVIGYRAWQVRFNSDPDVIGRTIVINKTAFTISGVAPEKFRGHVNGLDEAYYQVWLPLSHHPRLIADDGTRIDRDTSWLRVVGRLHDGTTMAEADARVQAVMAGLATRYPSSNALKVGGVEPYFPSGARKRAQIALAKLMMYAMAGVVLLVVTLNLSGMMLVRSAMRERELAVRLAIGASRWRLMQYHLSEALVLAIAGGSLASAVLFGVPALAAWYFNYSGEILDVFNPGLGLVAQCIALCFFTSLVLGMLPAIRFSRPMILSTLKSDSKGSGRRVGRLQRLTAALQAGLAVPFLVIGGVKLDQARVVAMADLGFQPQGLYATRLDLSAVADADADRERFVRDVEQSIAGSPGVVSVSLGDGMPLDFTYRNTRVAREHESIFFTAHSTRIAPDYLDTVGIRLLAGRTIDATDTADAERVVLLSEPLAKQLYPSGNPIGARVAFAPDDQEPQLHTVIGVTGDVVSTQAGNPRPQLFVPIAQHPASRVMVIARSAADEVAMRRVFESAIQTADRDYVPGEPGDLFTGEALVEGNSFDLLTHSAVGGGAALIALVLASLGVYGVIAFMVTTRTREIGVRLALGASRWRVVRDVLSDSLVLVVPGIAFGLVMGVLWVRKLDPSWYALGGVEPLVYACAAGIALLVAALAGLPSARRASSVQPIVAMRAE